MHQSNFTSYMTDFNETSKNTPPQIKKKALIMNCKFLKINKWKLLC